MAPDSNQTPGMGLPPPPIGQVTSGTVPGIVVGGPLLDTPIPGALPSAPVSNPQLQQNAATTDGEALDQEWVEKAKDIVESTKGDPFTQSNELQKVRAGFLNARYNKQINVAEDQP